LPTAEFSLDAYRDWLHKGLGRAVLATTPERAQALRPILLDACLHNRAYESRCERSRAPWMLSMLHRTEDLAHYARQLCLGMKTVGDDDDGAQLVHLAALLVLQGFDELAPLVREALALHPDSWWFGRKEQVLIDGLDGLVRVAEYVGARLLAGEQDSESEWLIDELSPTVGRDVVMERLETEAESSPAVAHYLFETANGREREEARKARHGGGARWATLAEVEALLRADGKEWYLRRIGRRMPDELALEMSARLAAERDDDMLFRYLILFGSRVIPECPERVWDLARGAAPRLQHAALDALELSTDPRRASLARELLAADPGVVVRGVLPLLRAGTPEDAALVLDGLAAVSVRDADDLHRIQLYLGSLVNERSPVMTAELARWGYEHGPCGLCRVEFVRRLIELDALDPARREECARDVDEEVRMLVTNPPLPHAEEDRC